MKKYDHGKAFGSGAIFASYIFLVLGVLMAFEKPYFGIPVFLVALFVLFTRNGVELDSNKNLVKDYSLLLGLFKSGKWSSLSDYKYVTVMPSKISNTSYSRSGRSSTETKYYQSIFIFKEKLRGKIEVARFKSYDKAEIEAQKVSAELKLEYFKYSPEMARKILIPNK